MIVDQNNSLEAAMTLYCGIDLHSNNHVICVIDDKDQRLFEGKLDKHPELTLAVLSKYKKRLKGVAIESTFNWYWLADALMVKGYHVDLMNTAKVIQYSGLKRTKGHLMFCGEHSHVSISLADLNGLHIAYL